MYCSIRKPCSIFKDKPNSPLGSLQRPKNNDGQLKIDGVSAMKYIGQSMESCRQSTFLLLVGILEACFAKTTLGTLVSECSVQLYRSVSDL